MWRNILLVAVRSAYRDPGGSAINLLGLVTGLAVFMAAMAYVYHERSYDRFFTNSGRIVTLHTALPEDSPFRVLTTKYHFYSPSIVEDVRQNFPEVDAATIFTYSDHSVSVGGRKFNHIVRFADADFFHIFDLQFIAGGAEGWQARSDIALLDRSMALKLFGATNPADAIGRIVTLDGNTDLEVAGVYEDVPANSQFHEVRGEGPKMGIITTIPLYERLEGVDIKVTNARVDGDVYLLLPEGLDRQALTRDLTATTLEKLNDDQKRFYGGALVVPLTDIHTDRLESWDLPTLQFAPGTGVLILAIAIINTVSLNTARMIRRSREITLRRIVGAGRRDLVAQLFIESMAITGLAMFLALGLLIAAMPWVTSAIGYAFSAAAFVNGGTLLVLAGLGILVAALSVSYPAFLLSGFSRGFSLGRAAQMTGSAAWIRKLLAVIQFTAVTALVMLTVAAERQNSYLVALVPDLNASRVVTVHGLNDEEIKPRLPAVAAAFERIPDVELVSRSAITPYGGLFWRGSYQTLDNASEPFSMNIANVDDRFLSLYGIDLVAGRDFDRNRGQDMFTPEESRSVRTKTEGDEGGKQEGEETEMVTIRSVMINEAAVNQLGLSSADDAVGKTLRYAGLSGSTALLIVGVTRDINLISHDAEVPPTIFHYNEFNTGNFSILFSTPEDVDIEAVNGVLSELVPDAEPKVRGLEDAISASMDYNRKIQSGVMILAIIAIILAATGLYALAAFLAASKRREMGIRKVMGARSGQLVSFLVWQFLRPVTLSLLIGLPVGWVMMATYLERFVHRFTPGADLLLSTAAITVIITCTTVLTHAIRTAWVLPAEILREE